MYVLMYAVQVKATVPYIITQRNIAHLQGYNLAYGNGIPLDDYDSRMYPNRSVALWYSIVLMAW